MNTRKDHMYVDKLFSKVGFSSAFLEYAFMPVGVDSLIQRRVICQECILVRT